MYVSLFHAQTNLIDTIHKFFFSSALSPLTIITKDSVFSRVFSLLPKLLLKVVFHCNRLRENKKTEVCSFVAVKYYLSVLCRLRFYAIFAQGKTIKTYKRTTWLFVCFCYFSNPVTTCGHVTRQRGFRARRIDYRFLSCLPKKCVPKFGFVSLLDSLNLF